MVYSLLEDKNLKLGETYEIKGYLSSEDSESQGNNFDYTNEKVYKNKHVFQLHELQRKKITQKPMSCT